MHFFALVMGRLTDEVRDESPGTSIRHFCLYFCLQEAELELAELKMLRFSLGVTRMDRIRSEIIRETK